MNRQCFFGEIYPSFLLRNCRSDKPTTINFTIRINQKLFRLSTGVKVYPQQWDFKKKRAVICHWFTELDNINNSIANETINEYITAFDKFRHYICSNPHLAINADKIFNDYINKTMKRKKCTNQFNILEYLKEAIANDNTISDTTKVNYRKGLTALTKYLTYRQENNLPKLSLFKDFTTEIFWAFADWVVKYDNPNGKKLSMTTVNDRSKLAHTIITKYGQNGGYLTNAEACAIKYKQLTNKTSKDNEIFLRDDEVMKLYRYQPTNKTDEYVRDLFLLECTTGQRFSDIEKLGDNIQVVEGIQIINLITKKTSTKISANFIFNIAKEILVNKYNYKLPSINKDTINKRIKIIAKEAGITGTETISKHYAGNDKPTITYKPRYDCISSHTGRRTFISLLVIRGWNYERISKYTGQTIDMVEHYDKSKEADIAIYRSLQKNKPNDILCEITSIPTKHTKNDSVNKMFAESILLRLSDLYNNGVNILTLPELNTAITTIKNSVILPINDTDKDRIKNLSSIIWNIGKYVADSELILMYLYKAKQLGIDIGTQLNADMILSIIYALLRFFPVMIPNYKFFYFIRLLTQTYFFRSHIGIV